MVPAIRPSLTTRPGARSAGRPARSRRRPKLRVRRLAFEVCEPRWPLTAILELAPVADLHAGDESRSSEPIAEVGREQLQTADCTGAESDTTSPDGKPAPSEDGSPESEVDELRGGDSPEWNDLGSGMEPAGLAAALDESRGECLEDADSSPPLRLAQDQPEAASERDGPAGQDGDALPPLARPAAASAGFEAERREWTDAGTVRYPLNALPPPGSADPARFASSTPAAATGFLDVGRIFPAGTARRRLPSAVPEPLGLAQADASSSALVHDLAIVDLAARSPRSQEVKPHATAVRSSLTGETRGQRMLLLAASNARPRRPALVPPWAVSPSQPESLDVQTRAEAPSRSGADPGVPADSSTAATNTLGSLPWPANKPDPVAENAPSRSAMDCVTVIVLLAARLFRQSRRRRRQTEDDQPHSLERRAT